MKGDGKPNAYWRRFKERLDIYDQTPVEDWKEEHMLGHILKRYRDNQGIEFSLSYSGPPTKCKEIYCMRRVLLHLGTEDGPTVKKYIDWVFDTIIIPQKVTFSSIAYFFTANFILKFKQELRKQTRITRATKLPDEFVAKAIDLELDVRTYGDLAFAKAAMDDDPENEELNIYFQLFTELKNAGFNDTVLSSLD